MSTTRSRIARLCFSALASSVLLPASAVAGIGLRIPAATYPMPAATHPGRVVQHPVPLATHPVPAVPSSTSAASILTRDRRSEALEASRASEAAPDPTTWGPYGVGVFTVEILDPSRDRALTTDIWYPAVVDPEAPGEYYSHLWWGIASRDAAPDLSGGPYPLVMFSHGSGGFRDQSVFFTEMLASHGYVVVAPDHEGNTLYDYDAILSADAAIDRPLDIRFVLDYVLEMNDAGTFPVGGAIDPDRIGMSGHSYGAYTTTVICGAWLDVQAAREGCAEGDQTYCEAVRYAEELYGEGVQWLDLSDSRVSACTPMAPGLYELFGDEGLSHTFAPMGVLASAGDTVLDYETDSLPLYEGIPGAKALLTMLHRDHYAYCNLWDLHLNGQRCTSYEVCPDRDPGHIIINSYTTPFFGYYLKGLIEYSTYLDPDYVAREYGRRATLENELQ